ncbi:MAG: thioredoxin family protein [Saprospiraceae bacterium]|nr:thioredoxin family protein [Saprospiraceae bacterium]
MKIFKIFALCLFAQILTGTAFGQEAAIYDEHADAAAAIDMAIEKASSANQHVFIQAGGNWCSWCRKFAKFSQEDFKIDSILKSSYQVVHLNYSKTNKNEKIFEKYGFPQRFGFPVFIILDGKGKLLHIQNSEYLEDNKGSYDRNRVFRFLQAWTPAAIDPSTYTSKK